MIKVEDKTVARAACLARRSAVAASVRAAFASRIGPAGHKLIEAWADDSEPTVSLYRPIRDEADPWPLLERLSRSGIRTALPRTFGRGSPLVFHLWGPGDPLEAGRWDIPEPSPSAPVVEPDVLVVPLAAFDRQGYRLGYGAGFYDNALLALRRRKRILAIGVAFMAQEVAAVPREAHDQRLDALITEDETFMFSPD